MCKSADDPNGPYRCAADAQRNLDRATQRLSDAIQAQQSNEQQARDAEADGDIAAARVTHLISQDDALWVRNGKTAPAREHVQDMIDSGLIPEEKRDQLPAVVFEDYRLANNVRSTDRSLPRYATPDDPSYQEARAAVDEAYRRRRRFLNAAQRSEEKVRVAAANRRAALTDYHATTRGLGELQAEYDESARVKDTDTPEFERMRDQLRSASDRMNLDAAVRLQKQGRGRDEFTYSPLHTGETDSADPRNRAAAHLAQRDRITGATKTYKAGTPEAGETYNLHSVTLTRRDEEGLHEEKFRLRIPADQPAPTCADVLQEISLRAREHDVASNFEEWRDFQGMPSKNESPGGYANAKKAYASHKADAARLAKFLGPARYTEYTRSA